MSNGVSVQDVYNYVQEKIIRKEYFPGNRIIEADLAREVKTSRTTVRSAMLRLQYAGFVKIVPNRGTYVAKPSIIGMHHMYDVRRILEAEAVRRAIPRITKESLEAMEKCLEEQYELEKKYDVAKYVKLNRIFHWEIVKAADNEYLEKYLTELFNKTEMCLIFYDNSVTNTKSIKTHTDILNAIKAGDEDAAVEAISIDSSLAKNCIEE